MVKKIKKVIKQINKRRFLFIFLKALVAFIILVGILFFLVYTGLFGTLPTKTGLKHIQNYVASEVYSDEGKLLGRYYLQNRTTISYEQIPEFFIQALIATEDVRFMKHKGIDWRSMPRVLFKTVLLRDENSGGGSTITQQLAKNLYPRKDYWIITVPVAKFREMIIARRIEKAYSKKEILELYLNTVSFGENTYGIETAATRFFNKNVQDLKIEESAVLVGMLKATDYYNPKKHYDRALARRNVVLNQMVKYHLLDTVEVSVSTASPIKLDYVRYSHYEGPAPYFREQLRLKLESFLDEYNKQNNTNYNLYTDGLKIYTSLNYDLQLYAEQAVYENMARLQKLFDRHWKTRDPWGRNTNIILNELKKTKRYKQLASQGMNEDEIMTHLSAPVKTEIFSWEGSNIQEMSPLDSVKYYQRFLHAGLLSMEAKTGLIRAWVGGINHKYFQYDHVTSKRQAGSVFKPFIYAAALENGADPCDFFPNDSVVYEDYNNWIPRNADRQYGGYYSLKGGLTQSVNTVSVHLLMKTGFDETSKLASEMGIRSDLPKVPSLALGAAEVSLYDIVKAYAIFLNRGNKVQPLYLRMIKDKYDNILYSNSLSANSTRIIQQETADIMVALLENVVNNGTASSLRTVYGFTNELAGKTGTTQNHSDGWFIGFTPDLITGVWVGGENPIIRFRSLALGQGSATALPLWANFMNKIYGDQVYRHSRQSAFQLPENIMEKLDCEEFSETEPDFLDKIFKKSDKSIIEIIKNIFRRKDKNDNNINNNDDK